MAHLWQRHSQRHCRTHFRMSFALMTAVLNLIFNTTACSAGHAPESAQNEIHVTPQAGSLVDLQGTWQSACNDANELGLGEKSTLTFDSLALKRTVEIAPHGDCSSSYVEAVIIGDYSLGRDVTTAVDTRVAALDIRVVSAKVRALSDRAASILNLARTCGIRRWVVGDSRDVTARLGRENCFRLYSKSMFTIYSIEGNKMFFGDGEGQGTPEKRPMALDKLSFFTKQ
jgi:hypothetical protein